MSELAAGGAPRGDVLRIEDLTITYGNGFEAVHGISLQVHSGETVAIVGRSGCGKSSVVRAILGLQDRRTRVAGSIALQGIDLTSLAPKQRRAGLATRIGYVAQDPYSACDPLRTVAHHVREPWKIHGRDVARSEIADRLTSVGIPNAERRMRQYPHQWSGGMLQRATITASTALDPVLTVADEPTSALDAELADGVMRVLRERSRALLFVTHDLELAAAHADRIVVMHRGSIVEEGPSAGLIAAPSHPATQVLLQSGYAERSIRGGEDSAALDDCATSVPAPVVTASGIRKTYSAHGVRQVALDDVSLTVDPGQIVGIAGPSGSGKSTMLRILSGIEHPDEGTIAFGDAGAETPKPGAVMPIFQDPVASLDQRWPLWRTITEPLTTGGDRIRKPQRQELARAALDKVGLGSIAVTAHPAQLSVGQCQRVAIARAVIAQPSLIVADEPTASLDVTTAAQIADVLREVRDSGTALVIVSHDRRLLESVCDRVLTIHDGVLKGAVSYR